VTEPQTMAEAVKIIDSLRAELRSANATIEILRSERNTWRTATGR
jgi:hypothetical protein